MHEDTTSVEAVEEAPSLAVALRLLSTRIHPSLPSIVEQDRVGCWLVVREEAGPGRPLAGGEPWSAARAAAAGAGLCDGLETLRRDTQGRLPVGLTPEDLWITRAGVLRLRKLGLPRWGEAPDLAGVMQGVAEAVRLLTRPEERPRLAWVDARCASGDPARCYGSLPELGEALRRVAGEGRAEGLTRPAVRVGRSPAPRVRRRPWPAAAALLLAILAAWLWYPEPPAAEEGLAAAHGSRVSLLSRTTGSVLVSWELPEPASGLGATADGRLVLALQREAGGVALVRTGGFARLAARPDSLLVEGEHAFVTHPEAGLVTLLRLRDCRCAGVVAVPPGPMHLAARNGILYCSGGGRVRSFAAEPLRPLADVGLPGAGPAVTSLGGRLLYVAEHGRPRVHVLDAATLAHLGSGELRAPASRLVRWGASVWALEPGLLEPLGEAPWIPVPRGAHEVAAGPSLLWLLAGNAVAVSPDRGRTEAWLRLPEGTTHLAEVPAPRMRR